MNKRKEQAMNKVILIGRLTRDPDFRATANSSLARFSVAVDRRYKQDGQPTADFPGCIAWGKTAEFIDKYFRKGMKIAIEGRIQTGSYEKDGRTVYTTDVVAESVEFAESKNASSGGGARQEAAAPPEIDEGEWLNVADDSEEGLPFD